MEMFMLYKRCNVFYLDSSGQLTWLQNTGTEVLNCLSEAVLLDTHTKIRCSLDKVLNVTGKECITNASCVKS